jgi:hypothetical protein
MATTSAQLRASEVDESICKGPEKFLEYQASNPDVKPLFQLPVFASIADEPPKYMVDWPQGQLIVYPEFLAFLTLVEGDPGKDAIWKRVIQDTLESMVSLYRLNRIITDPVKIIEEVARHMGGKYQHEDTLSKALANSNSIFLPLTSVMRTSTGNKSGSGEYIRLYAPNKQIIICEDCNGEMASESGFFGSIKFAFTYTFGMLTGKRWHPELISMLEARARENLVRRGK